MRNFCFLDIKQKLRYIEGKLPFSTYPQIQYYPMLMVWFLKHEDKAVNF